MKSVNDKSQIEQVENSVPLLKQLREIFEETDIRSTQSKKLELLEYEPSKADSSTFLVPPGSVTIFLSKNNSKLLNEIKHVILKDKKRDVELNKRLIEIYSRRKLLSMDEAVRLLKAQNTIVDITYGGATLASNLFIPDDLEVAMISLPYNGGAVLKSGIEILARIKGNEKDEISAIAVRHAPKLTKAEIAALKLISQNQIGSNIGKAAMCYAVTAVAIVAVVIFATYACPGKYDDFHLDEEVIKNLGPDATAKQLLALRRKILENKAVH